MNSDRQGHCDWSAAGGLTAEGRARGQEEHLRASACAVQEQP